MNDDKTISAYDSTLTLDKIRFYTEYQYLERKGIYENSIKPAKIADEIIGMLNA